MPVGTHAAEQGAGAQAGPHDGGGGGAGAGRGAWGAAEGRGPRDPVGLRESRPGPASAPWPRPGPAPPAKAACGFPAALGASRDSPRAGALGGTCGESGWSGDSRGCASRPTEPGSVGGSCPGPK